MSDGSRLQLHLKLPYKKDPREHPRVEALLAEGYLIEEIQRVTDKEIAVTLHRPARAPSGA